MAFAEMAVRLADVGRQCYARGWALGTSGNFSAVVSRDPLRLAITTSGVLFVCGSIVMFSAYALLSHRVVPRTDSLTAATWTAIGAATGKPAQVSK